MLTDLKAASGDSLISGVFFLEREASKDRN
jgi:hypothetical protein